MSIKNPNPVNPIILEGLWGLGKTSLAQAYCGKYGYEFMPEPFHTRDSKAGEIKDLDGWYLEQHKDRQQFFKQSTLVERSVLSSFAFRYALEQALPDASYLESLKKDMEKAGALLVYLKENVPFATGHNGAGEYSAEIEKILLNEKAQKRYDEWYTDILPRCYGILPFILKVSADGSRKPVESLADEIHTVLAANRMAQTNVVCFTRDEKWDIKILTLKRNEQKGGFWQTITGGVHIGEDPLAAASREALEEIGISNAEIFWTPLSYFFMGDDGYELSEYVFGCEIKEPSRARLSDEHTAFEWLEPEDAKKRVKYDNNKLAIDAIYKKIGQS
ncbi:MAG TPA: NUDIX domain-containing protein [Candidatus Paceibacterota bacterium]|nr:NUDIX domain-containing protein [Candidatus Paceibacterota bacterium]